jgi:hypothetical protein
MHQNEPADENQPCPGQKAVDRPKYHAKAPMTASNLTRLKPFFATLDLCRAVAAVRLLEGSARLVITR